MPFGNYELFIKSMKSLTNKEITAISKLLNNGKTILYPTDTVWGIGCDATNKKAVQKIYHIKKRSESKSLVVLVDSIQMLQEYIKEIPEKALEILSSSTQPTTIIYQNPKGFAENIIADDQTIAIRIVQHPFCSKLIKSFGKPIVSTSANISGEETPTDFSKISNHILNAVDYIVPLPSEKMKGKSSTILKIEDEKIIVIRE